jgi:hypothetical protein
VSSPEDERPAQALGAKRAHPSFADGISVGSSDRGQDGPHDVGPEHLVERPGELGVSVMDQKPGGPSFLLEGHGQVSGLLGDPGRVRVAPPR